MGHRPRRAQSYFGKPVKDLTLAEGAFIAGLTKGPAYYNPDRYRERAQERLAYVLTRMKDDGVITAAQATEAEAERLNFAAFARVRRDTGFHLVDEVGREARALAGIGSLTAQSYEIRSTIRPALQRATEAALQEGLAQYEQSAGRVEFRAPEANLSDAIRKLDADPQDRPQQAVLAHRARAGAAAALRRALDAGGRGREAKLSRAATSIRVGLQGRPHPAAVDLGQPDPRPDRHLRRRLRQSHRKHAYRDATAGSIAAAAPASSFACGRPCRASPWCWRTSTGRVLAMAGGFSYPLSQLNRVTQSRRQPGSSFKPMTYLAALNSGLQPNTLVDDAPITYPPIGGANAIHAPDTDYWSPHNYDGGYSGTMTMRRALEHIEEPGDGAPARRRHRQRAEPEPRRDLQARRSRRMSIRNASGTIRSCSAPSRCGRSTSPASMPRSPTRANARRRM